MHKAGGCAVVKNRFFAVTGILSRTAILCTKFDYIILIILFALSRLCVRLAGIEFESIGHRWCYQYLPPNILKVSLAKSLWYLHMQPPFFNFLLGIGYKLFGDNDNLFFNILFLLFSLLSIICCYAALKKIDLHRWICFLVALLLIASPSLILFENILFYSVFVFCMLSVMLFALCGFSKSSDSSTRFRFLCLFSLAALLLMLTRCAFHIIWFAAVVLAFYMLWRRNKGMALAKNRFLLAFVPTISFIVLLLVKNYFLFGVFQNSSWFGMNLSRVTLESIPVTKLEELYKQGKVSVFSLIVKKNRFPFLSLDKYGIKQGTTPTHKHPALAWYLNSLEYIAISQHLAHDAQNIIKTCPAAYLKTCCIGSRLFFHPTTDGFISRTFDTRTDYHLFWNSIYYPFSSNVLQILAYVSVVAFSGIYTAYSLFSKKGTSLRHGHTAVFIFFTLTCFFFTANLFEFGENNRFRFEVLPLVVFGIPWSYVAMREIRREHDQSPVSHNKSLDGS